MAAVDTLPCPPAPAPSAPTPSAPPAAIEIDLRTASDADLAAAIAGCGTRGCGLLLLRGVLPTTERSAALASAASLLDAVAAQAALGERANRAYTKNLVYKDSFAAGRGGPDVDQKRVIDLSPARLDAIAACDPTLEEELGSSGLRGVLAFFDRMRSVAQRVVRATGQAGGFSVAMDTLTNYRIVNYYARPREEAPPPRCGEHRDFGTCTLIFDDGVPGLQASMGGEWVDVCIPDDGAALLFGYVTAVRSNGRIPATLHRVVDPRPTEDAPSPRRTALVFFVAPEADTQLEPSLIQPGEQPVYRTCTAEDLRSLIGRKWRYREGTLGDDLRRAEELERREMMLTQDDVVRRLLSHPPAQ